KPDDPHYELARKVGAAIPGSDSRLCPAADRGIMEAVNRGAKEVGGRFVGCNVELPFEQSSNHISRSLSPAALFFRPQSAAGKIFLLHASDVSLSVDSAIDVAREPRTLFCWRTISRSSWTACAKAAEPLRT